MNMQEFMDRSQALGHAIQTGVAIDMEHGSKDTEPKHLRVGVNMALVETAAMGRLLMNKGIITEEEYFDSIIELLEIEVKNYEMRLSNLLGTKITLG